MNLLQHFIFDHLAPDDLDQVAPLGAYLSDSKKLSRVAEHEYFLLDQGVRQILEASFVLGVHVREKETSRDERGEILNLADVGKLADCLSVGALLGKFL